MTENTPFADDLDQVVYAGMTRRVLESQFNRVCDSNNWKLPIDRKIPFDAIYEPEVEEIRLAVVFYTGGHATVHRQRDGYRITAPGYYASVGA
jgi:hypothetical protein